MFRLVVVVVGLAVELLFAFLARLLGRLHARLGGREGGRLLLQLGDLRLLPRHPGRGGLADGGRGFELIENERAIRAGAGVLDFGKGGGNRAAGTFGHGFPFR